MTPLAAQIESVMAEARQGAEHYPSGQPGNTGLHVLIDGIEKALVTLAVALDELREHDNRLR